MPENNGCEQRPGEHCKFGARFDMLEKRVHDLEEGQDEEAEFRRTYYRDRETRIKRDAEIDFKMQMMDGKLDTMDGKLDKMTNWKDEQDNKPNKLLDNIKDKLVGAVVGAIGGGLIVAAIYLIVTLASG